jgi:REP element-mobilizing transposase RayT
METMAGTYSQIYIQVVFSPLKHENCIRDSWSDELYKYIGGIIRNKGQKLIAINGMQDHVHIFMGIKPSIAVSDLVRDIKNNSSNFINNKKFVKGKFSWQEGFGSFSYSHSQVDLIYQYIMNQREHHKRKSFREEYLDMLKKSEIDFNEKYLFDWFE